MHWARKFASSAQKFARKVHSGAQKFARKVNIHGERVGRFIEEHGHDLQDSRVVDFARHVKAAGETARHLDNKKYGLAGKSLGFGGEGGSLVPSHAQQSALIDRLTGTTNNYQGYYRG